MQLNAITVSVAQNVVNIALNRPTTASSQYMLQYSYLATDGNFNLASYNCFSSWGPDSPVWWAVDLGVQTYVYGVNMTNRADCCC